MIDYDNEDDDPVVAEVRRAREQLLAECGGDLNALIEQTRRKTEELAKQGWKVASGTPSMSARPLLKKKAG